MCLQTLMEKDLKPSERPWKQFLPVNWQVLELSLNELAMDIDKTLIELRRKDPASAVKLYKNALAQAQKRETFWKR